MEMATTVRRSSEPETAALDYIAPGLRPLAVRIETLQPMPGNARAHGARDLDAIAVSLKTHGQQKPIVIKAEYRGLRNVIVAGNGTWLAARRLGWQVVAATVFEGSDEEAIAYSLRDNRTAELSSWNADALRALQADVDLSLLWGDDADLGALLGGADAMVPTFAPIEPEYRLDQLAANTTCPACGHQFHREAV